jgi:hypothetical protein
MTAFAGVVNPLPALQHFRGVFRVCRIDRQRCGVMQTMSQGYPSLPVLID